MAVCFQLAVLDQRQQGRLQQCAALLVLLVLHTEHTAQESSEAHNSFWQ